ncbi:hypothetical protein CS022_21335 [Veronia nyctiphanis]|uniref:Uncharacterized protein n=1 Tax=Veronia nyctiphanis TaxID=1278244 RepID=A0A4Q0YKF5_9GAMM|nr:hypothetical protein [Veronia nyctiphanis]RXJ71212.1 hypothetical protein CS022_21335 [Veronia nyctiphanis]
MKYAMSFLSLIIAGCTSHSSAAVEGPSVLIDKGTVIVTVADSDFDKPYTITHAPQGKCVPEVSINTEGNRTEVTHTKACFGEGRNEGTVFNIVVNPSYSHHISLKAGQIFAPDIRDSATSASHMLWWMSAEYTVKARITLYHVKPWSALKGL